MLMLGKKLNYAVVTILLCIIFIEVLVCNRCISSILLVYTTSVDIDQRFIVSDVSITQSGAQYMHE